MPSSCCVIREGSQVCNRKEPKYIYSVVSEPTPKIHIILKPIALNFQGCFSKLRHLINTNLTTVGVTTSAIAFLPLFGTILSFALASVGEKILEYERLL